MVIWGFLFSSCLHFSTFQANLSTVIPAGLKLCFFKIEMFSVKKWTGSNCLGMEPTWVPSHGSPGTEAPGPAGHTLLRHLVVALGRKVEKSHGIRRK